MFKFIILGAVALLALAFVLPIVVRSGKKTAKAILETDQPKPAGESVAREPATAETGTDAQPVEKELADAEPTQKDA